MQSPYKTRPASQAITGARFEHPVTGRRVTVTSVDVQTVRSAIVIYFRTDDGVTDFVTMPLDAELSLNLHCAA